LLAVWLYPERDQTEEMDSAERDDESLGAAIRERDFSRTVRDGVLLPEELVHARFHDQTRAGRIDIQPVGGAARRTAIDAYPEAPSAALYGSARAAGLLE
jgi:hypothetical protein